MKPCESLEVGATITPAFFATQEKSCVAAQLFSALRNIAVAANGCWEWQGAIGTRGYGVISIDGRTWQAHRLSFRLFNGDPGDKLICHRCDNRRCINPTHLFPGTTLDNSLDSIAKGRRHGAFSVKLNAEQVTAIRQRHARTQERYADIAVDYGISDVHVGRIIRRAKWAHIP